MGFDFRKKSTAERLRNFADGPIYQHLVEGGEDRKPGLRSFIMIFDEEIPAASRNPDGTWELGVGIGIQWTRENPDNAFSQEPLNDASSSTLVPSRDQQNRCVRKRVFNTLQETTPACVPIECVQDQSGDLYVSLNNDPAPSADTTTTTTVAANCAGRCKWIWSSGSSAWVLSEDNCTLPTTTTTTTTTEVGATTTTTTTTEDCNCPSPSTSTTTTTTADCNCTYPLYCGTEADECTYTYCSQYETVPNVECTTTTTTSTTTTLEPTTTTTTTTCDCNTTTTEAPCGTGCVWAWAQVDPNGTYQWVKIDDGCEFLNDCPTCDEPTGDGLTNCDQQSTPCNGTTTTTTTEPPIGVCGGTCTWTWIPEFAIWIIPDSTFSNCNELNSGGCGCVPPSDPPDNPSECVRATGPCQPTSPDPGTTADPGTTTTLPPCYNCYTTTTTSTSTTSSTTTTQHPCIAGRCRYEWTGTVWAAVINTCLPSCNCEAPAYDGHDTCETIETPCSGPTSTTTTTTSSTTTTTSSTTTTTTSTTACPGCSAFPDIESSCGDGQGNAECRICWTCVDLGGGNYGWDDVHSDTLCNSLLPSPELPPHSIPCNTEEDYNFVCLWYNGAYCTTCTDCDNTTTTTTTTSTTTTTTTTPEPVGACCCDRGGPTDDCTDNVLFSDCLCEPDVAQFYEGMTCAEVCCPCGTTTTTT